MIKKKTFKDVAYCFNLEFETVCYDLNLNCKSPVILRLMWAFVRQRTKFIL